MCLIWIPQCGNSLPIFFSAAVSTKLLLDGKTPAMYDPALHQSRLKRDLLAGAKSKDCSGGLGIEGRHLGMLSVTWNLAHFCQHLGVVNQYMSDLRKPLESRYIHKIVTTPNGGILIFTFQPKLASLIHKALSLLVDTTFKRAAGDLNEWEIVIWYPAINRSKFKLLCKRNCQTKNNFYISSCHDWARLYQ